MKTVLMTTNASNPAAPLLEAYIDKVEVARRLKKTPRTIDNYMKRGIVPYYKIRNSVYFKWSEVERHIAEHFKVCAVVPPGCKTA